MALKSDHGLLMKIHNSDGANFLNKMHSHSFSQNIFYGNLKELKVALNFVENSGMKLMSNEHKEEGTQVYRDVNRLFHNFLSSAKTLIEHTRIFMDTHFKNTSVNKDYTHKIKMEFSQDELSRFVQDLRNYMLHQGLPHSNMSFSIDNKDPDDQKAETTVSLDIEKLTEWSRWSKGSKRYLAQQGKHLKLSILVEEYSQKIVSLNVWLEQTLYKYHGTELQEYQELQNKFQEQTNKV
ncbi:MAG: hypothetical protein KAH72_02470 [Flavobacteriaceae bacterium]|nr:hypothetical protein [Flavobacteriaceae bacterium]